MLGERVVRITQLGTYACREMAAYRGWVSEHSYANAIDVESFVLESGKRVSVLRSFERGDETRTRAGMFLRVVSRRAYDEEILLERAHAVLRRSTPEPLSSGPRALPERRDAAAGGGILGGASPSW